MNTWCRNVPCVCWYVCKPATKVYPWTAVKEDEGGKRRRQRKRSDFWFDWRAKNIFERKEIMNAIVLNWSRIGSQVDTNHHLVLFWLFTCRCCFLDKKLIIIRKVQWLNLTLVKLAALFCNNKNGCVNLESSILGVKFDLLTANVALYSRCFS